jgi:hypothetical protein
MHAGGVATGEHTVSLISVSPKPLYKVASVSHLSLSGDTQFGYFREERKKGDHAAADEHLRLAAMYGHETARKLLLRRRAKEKKKADTEKMKVAEII